MLSAAGLSSGHPGTVKAKTLNLAPPPSGGVRIRSPLLPPPNDSAAARMTSGSHNTTLKGPKEVARHSADPLADLSQLEASRHILAASLDQRMYVLNQIEWYAI